MRAGNQIWASFRTSQISRLSRVPKRPAYRKRSTQRSFIVRYATVYILLIADTAFALNTVCGVLPRFGRGLGPPGTDKLPDSKRIVTANSKIRSLQVNLRCITFDFIGQIITARGWRQCALYFWLGQRSPDLTRISEDRRINSHSMPRSVEYSCVSL